MSIVDVLKKPISRRKAIKNTLAGSALLGAGLFLSGCGNQNQKDPTKPIVVEEHDSVSVLDTFTEADLTLVENGAWKLPLGTVLLQESEGWIPALVPNSEPTHIVKACAFSLKSKELYDVVTKTLNTSPNWMIYDACMSSRVFAWVELNMHSHNWVLYAGSFNNNKVENVVQLWSGDENFDPPSMACSGTELYWLVMPNPKGNKSRENSACYGWNIGSSSAQMLVESQGRFACPVALSGEVVVLCPRNDTTKGSINYVMRAYTRASRLETVKDELLLPAAIRPLYATYIGDQFAFSIEAAYESGGLLGQLGTFIGNTRTPFVYLSREPFAQVSGNAQGVFIIKNKASYFVVDVTKKTYALLPSEDRCVDYGEYPATSGFSSTFVTFSTLKNEETGYPDTVSVRSFAF